MNHFLKIIAWIRNREIIVLLACLVVVLGVWAFIKLADEVQEKGTQNFDERMIRKMRTPEDSAIPIGPPWLHEVGRDITALSTARRARLGLARSFQITSIFDSFMAEGNVALAV